MEERIQVVGDLWSGTAAPTTTHLRRYELAGEEFAPVLENLRRLVTVDLKRVEGGLEAAGIPWTPGRIAERWKKP